MQRTRSPSAQTISVLGALVADPARQRYDYDLVNGVHLKSGLLATSWEPSQAVRAPRRLHRLAMRTHACLRRCLDVPIALASLVALVVVWRTKASRPGREGWPSADRR